jgi:hypothetical protein
MSESPSDTSLVTVDQSAQTPGPDDRSGEVASITATVLTAVERQLSRYFSAMTQRVDDSLARGQQLQTEMHQQLAVHATATDAQRAANEAYQQALQRAIDERLAEITAHHEVRISDLDERLRVVAAQPAGVSPEDLLQIRQSMREDIWKSLAPVTERLDAVADANRRTDEQATALVQHVNTATATLASRIEDGDERVTKAFEARVEDTRTGLDQRLDEARTRLDQRIDEARTALDQRIDEARSTLSEQIDRALLATSELAATTDARMGELQTATTERDEALARDITAVGDLVGEAVSAANARMAELEKRIGIITLDLATITTKVEGIDQDAIESLKSEMSAAIGEAMLVRIELDRVQQSTDDKLDKTAIRLGEIEALLTDEMDVGAAVQLERLDELERAITMLDPATFVRKDELLTDSSGSQVNSPSAAADEFVNGQALHGGHSPAGDDTHDSSYDDGSSSDAYSASEAWS